MATSGTSPARRAFSWLPSRPTSDSSVGDGILFGLCLLAGLIGLAVLAAVVYQIVSGADQAISTFGLSFLGHQTWAPNLNRYGAATFIFGTVVTSVIAMLIATPLSIAIALYLSMFAPRAVRAVVGPLVEMLAAIPSVILGFWGLIFFAPFIAAHVEPFLHDTLGFLPIFGAPQTTGLSLFTAGLILVLMVVPIIASLSRDLFLTVPLDLRDGASALGATRWEVIRGVVLPTTFSGVAAATMLGLGRALGEAIAVLSVVGDSSFIHPSTFLPGNTLASRIAIDIVFPVSKLDTSSIFYLAVILMVISVVTNMIARMIAARYDVYRVAT
jgi:phosphate transport system permease protein